MENTASWSWPWPKAADFVDAIARNQQPVPAPVAAATEQPEVPEVIKRTQTPRRKPKVPTLREQLLAFMAKSPEIIEVLDGTENAPLTVQLTKEVGNYMTNLILSITDDQQIFGTLDIWHKINRKAENIYHEARDVSVDAVLVVLEAKFGEWHAALTAPAQ
jgi:hypothetical protein